HVWHDPHDRSLGLTIGEVELDQAGGDQHAAHEEQQDDDVLAKEPAAPSRHRRNASARSRILRGTVSPSRSAVLRFTASSMRSAPSTGGSFGGVPRRILAPSAPACSPYA